MNPPNVSRPNVTPAQSGARMPVLFVGHGSPMNALVDNPYSATFAELGRSLPRPRAILAVSAHWFVGGTYLTGNPQPRTIHDFSGFPPALSEIEYRAPGSVDLAERVRRALGPERASLNTEWGLDHGTWTVLRFMFPEADIPVVQLSLDRRLDVRGHLTLARSLADLRHEGVLVLASGNITHNLRDAFTRMQTGSTETPPWATRFDSAVVRAVTQRDTEGLLRLWPDSDDGRLAHPSPDHFLPLLYAYGASDAQDSASFTSDTFDLGSLSMRNVLFAG
ncbi:MAG: 4,5-DOPA dioxygenase extradiol [Sandaracinaceae bacterium]|nr:4,5-DOPA dioxygenase extradiol [Sandaracinaceae bacterium]